MPYHAAHPLPYVLHGTQHTPYGALCYAPRATETEGETFLDHLSITPTADEVRQVMRLHHLHLHGDKTSYDAAVLLESGSRRKGGSNSQETHRKITYPEQAYTLSSTTTSGNDNNNNNGVPIHSKTVTATYLKLGLHGVVVEHHRRGPVGDLERRGARHLPHKSIITTITFTPLFSFLAAAAGPRWQRAASLLALNCTFPMRG